MSQPIPIEVRDVVLRTYDEFNAKDIDALLELLGPDAEWPDMIDGGHQRGHEALRRHWAGMFATCNPQVEPLQMSAEPDGNVVVDVRQVIRAHDDSVLADVKVQHAFTVEEGLVRRMDVRPL